MVLYLIHTMGLLIAVFLVVVQSHLQVVFISPDPETTPCPNGSLCMTLTQYASQSSGHIASETILRLLPGKHHLTRVLVASNLSSFTMLRASNISIEVIKISCLRHVHFEFHSIWTVYMSDLQLEGCYGNMVTSVMKFVLKDSLISSPGGKNEDMLTLASKLDNPERAFSFKESIVSISDCNFTNSKYGALVMNNNIVSINRCNFSNNHAHDGGGVYVQINNTVSITASIFTNNSAEGGGGGVSVEGENNVSIKSSIFDSNSVDVLGGGGIGALAYNNVSISNSTFVNNSVDYVSGGSVFAFSYNKISVINSTFIKNSVDNQGGGSIFVIAYNKISIIDSTFINNSADFGGGGIGVLSYNNVSIINSIFSMNNAEIGGAGIGMVAYDNLTITNSTFDNNSADKGGGGIISGSYSNVSISDSTFTNNCADYGGGGMFVGMYSNFSVTNSTFTNNSADFGGCIYVSQYSNVAFRGNTNMKNNRGNQSIIVYMVVSSVSFSGHTTIEKNNGSIFALSSNITFHGRTKFYHNSQPRNSIPQGGLITALRSNVTFTGNVEILNNTADNGGAISAVQSNVYIYGNMSIEDNFARHSGGGIYIYQSQLEFSTMNCTIRGNNAVGEGGGIHALGSTVSLSKGGSLLITENTAELGGGMCLELNSKLMLFTEDPLMRNSLQFTHNIAQHKGGAIYIADNTLSGTCAGNGSSAECFFQELALYPTMFDRHAHIPNNDTIFFNNSANEGETLYGGLLDRCTISPFVEKYKYRDAAGSDYFRNVSKIEDYKNTSIASDPVRVCICNNGKQNCSIDQSTKICVKKGHTINLSMVAVDQVGRSVSIDSGVIIHAFLSKANQGSGLKEGQSSQHAYINGSCTQFQYNIVSPKVSEELVLFAEGPCKDVGLSRLTITINFLECICPDGFIPLPSHTNCSCQCDPKLLRPQHYIQTFSSIDSTLVRSGTSWISYIHNCTGSLRHCSNPSSAGYIVNLYCPYDYCKPAGEHIHINVSMPNGSDTLCAFNRSGKLCGSCEGGLSHSLGSSQCMSCTNAWLALLIPFSLAGIALVVFILMLNLTVAFGTINGLIFYANIITAYRYTFLPFDMPNILTVFIAWLNLDLGIETCFYNGMDAYAKIWFQFIFPAYIILLIFVIILICKWSKGFANLIGSKNPVATLATLFLLSYTKLMRLTIIALNFTYLDHLNDGTKELVWLYDANVAYLKGKHIPLFVMAVLIIVLGIMYTFLLLSWQWLQHCSNWRILKWVNNTKVKALMDAYHAPYQPKHRYWTGLLLLVRVCLYLVSALNFSNDPSISLFSVSCVLVILLSLKMLCTQSKIYKNWSLDTLNTSCILNLLLFAISSFYLFHLRATNIDGGHNYNGSQLSLAYTSVSISLAIFLTILVYHLYKSFFKKMMFCQIISEKLLNTRNKNQQRHCNDEGRVCEEKHRLSNTSTDESSSEDDGANLRKELRDIVTGPPSEDEYRQLAADTDRARAMEKKSVTSKKNEVTHTVVEIQPSAELSLSLQIRDSPKVDHSPSQPLLQIRDSPNIDHSPPQPSLQIIDSSNIGCFPSQPLLQIRDSRSLNVDCSLSQPACTTDQRQS